MIQVNTFAMNETKDYEYEVRIIKITVCGLIRTLHLPEVIKSGRGWPVDQSDGFFSALGIRPRILTARSSNS